MNRIDDRSRARRRLRAFWGLAACLLAATPAAAGPLTALALPDRAAPTAGIEARRLTPPWSRRPLDLEGVPLERLLGSFPAAGGGVRLRLKTAAGIVGAPLALALEQGAFLVVAEGGRALKPEDGGPYWLVPTAPGVNPAWAIAARRVEAVAIEARAR